MNKTNPFPCIKCNGYMIFQSFSDFFSVFFAWKCVNCGAIIDKTIVENRRKSLEAVKP